MPDDGLSDRKMQHILTKLKIFVVVDGSTCINIWYVYRIIYFQLPTQCATISKVVIFSDILQHELHTRFVYPCLEASLISSSALGLINSKFIRLSV